RDLPTPPRRFRHLVFGRRCASCEGFVRACDRSACLEVPAKVLFALERLEQRLEVAGAKALCAFALYDLVKECRAVFHRLGEDLQQVTLVVAIDENAQIAETRHVLVDVPYSIDHGVIVRSWNAKELDSVVSKSGDR